MKKNSISRYASLVGVAVAMLLFTACDGDENTYVPGAETPEGCIGVYFEGMQSGTIIATPDEETIAITLKRAKTENAVSVPLIVKSVDTTAIQIPETVEFAAGEAQATVNVGIKDLYAQKIYRFTLAVDEAYADHYTQVNGATQYTASVMVAQWELFKKNAQFFYNGVSVATPVYYSDIYKLSGVNKFYITNFMGSGNDMYFTVGGSTYDENNLSGSSGELQPIGEGGIVVENYPDDGYNYYEITAANGDDYWETDGFYTYYFEWYGGENYRSRSYIDFSSKYIYLSGYLEAYGDDNIQSWCILYGVWQ